MTHALNLKAPVDTLAMEFTREFDAPVAAVYRAHAEPELVKQWLGPARNEIEIEHWDFRSGGGYRYLHRGPDGSEYWFNGVFHTVRAGEFVIQTFEFEGAPDMVNLEFMTFEDLGGRTRSICPNTGVRDGLLSSGMEDGMREGYERLDAVVKAL
ncbi:SRPBCC family protein [Mycobacterium sp.]|uniref:SRPBCC family protein n=1 Tax=Mycobacterium sp. TaxID=1785 RepID=UPI002CD33650|nr:SRPBCC family protein [Mycobacterium sp.]HME50126.1 SRPBCC family protein [Mycobacterium sp.]